MIGQNVSHYVVLELLGGRGMGVVYKARDTRLERSVAPKFLSSHLLGSAEAKRRFIVEAKAASSIDHPNIGTIYEVDETNDGSLLLRWHITKVHLSRNAFPEASSVRG